MIRLYSLFALLLIFYASLAFANKPSRWMIIDTDVGFDDLLAITHLLQQPDIEVKAITIAATGETPCVPGFINLKRMLQQLGKMNIPIFCGRATPLRGNHQFPTTWTPFQSKINIPAADSIPINAVEQLTAILQDSKQSYDIIALGPLTNLGELLQKSPHLAEKINMLYIMGGAVHVPGNLRIANKNLNGDAEWNIYIDPYAADLVFQSKVPITLIPLDITNQIKLPPDFYTQLQYSQTNAAKYMYQAYQNLPKIVFNSMAAADWYAWDSLAAVIASNPKLVKTTTEKLRVIVKHEGHSGALSLDKIHGKTVNVCYKIDRNKFMESLHDSLMH